MRKSINGLMTIVESNFSLDPFDGALFVFCNKKRDRLKILEWEVRPGSITHKEGATPSWKGLAIHQYPAFCLRSATTRTKRRQGSDRAATLIAQGLSNTAS